MTTANERLAGIRAKIERAKYHISDIETRIQAFRKSDPYRLVSEQDQQTGEIVYRVKVRAQPPTEIGIIVGEAVHHLRSVLDHLACRLVEANSGGAIDRTAFPIRETPAKYKTIDARTIEGISPQVVSLFETVQPYQKGFEPLGWVSSLDNFDKHQILLVVAYGFQALSMSYSHPILSFAHFRDRKLTPTQTGHPAFVFNHDTELLRMGGGPPIHQMNENLKLTYEIAFDEPQIVKCQPVLPLLHQMRQLVESVVDLFTPFL